MSCNCTDLNSLVNQTNSIVGGCYPTPTFSSGGSYAGVLLTGSTFTVGSITSSVFSGGSITGSSVTGLPTPTLASDAVTKSYADALAYQGPDLHSAVVAATTANITLGGSAPSTLDGKALALNNRILVKDQADNRQNGIYYVSILGTGANGTWTRAADADATGELKVGAQTYVQYGTTNGGSLWVMSNTSVPIVGTDAINFTAAYTFVALPAAKVTGQLTDSQIADLSAAKLTGTLGLPYSFGTNYNKVQITALDGTVVGDTTLNGAIYTGNNGTGNGVHTLWDGNGHFAELNAILTGVNPVTLDLRNDAGTTRVLISSAGTITTTGAVTVGGALSVTGNLVMAGTVGNLTSTGTLQSVGLYTTGNGIVDGTFNVGGDLTASAGNIICTAGTISTSGVTLLANDVFAPSGTLTGLNLQIANNIILTGKTITAPATTGARTINELSGSVNFAAAATSLVVTNSLVTADSVILVTKGTNDSTARLGAAVASAGSFTIYMDVAPAGETRVNFLVTN